METSSSFYITLPSNACKEIYPDNKASEYKTRLVRPIYLNHQYEVALVQIQFPHTWDTLHEKQKDNVIAYEVLERTPDGGYGEKQYSGEITIPNGYYSTIVDDEGRKSKALLNCLQRAFDRKERHRGVEDTNIVFDYDSHTNKVVITVKKDYTLYLSNAIAQALGFKIYHPNALPTEEWTHRGFPNPFGESQCFPYKEVQPGSTEITYTATNAPDVDRGFYSLYVYCSLCSPQFVGDSYVPLLRIVPNAGERNMITMDIDNPHYVPVNVRSFDTVEMNIKNDVSENVSFQTGKVICKLHFRTKH